MLPIAIGQRYSVMIKLDQAPGQYYLRFASYPVGDMQQVIEGRALVEYKVRHILTTIAGSSLLTHSSRSA